MKHYTLYEQVTGKVLQSGTCTDSTFHTYSTELTGVIEEACDPNSFYVKDGVLSQMPQAPSDHHVFDCAAGVWCIQPHLAWEVVQQQRVKLLYESDWVVTKATESGQPTPAEWSVYRQALRDITSQADPLNIVWPIKP